MDDLIIRTDNGDFDLFGSENIVQTFSVFNLSDISSRTSDYSNEFSLPLTSNNRRIIENVDYINCINTFPFRKIRCQLIVGGIPFKNGFIELTGIKEDIKARFYTGNGNFYDLAKSKNLNDLDWSSYDHIWNYTNAVAASNNATGYCYPVMTYNGQALGGDTVNIRLILPATYVHTILDKIYTDLGYTYVNDFDDTDLDLAILPYSKKNPEVSAEVQLINSVDLSNNNNYSPNVPGVYYSFPLTTQFWADEVNIPVSFSTIDTVGSSTNYNTSTQTFTAQYSGTYTYTMNTDFNSYDFITFGFSPLITSPSIFTETRFIVSKVVGGATTILQNVVSNNGVFFDFSPTTYTTINTIPTQNFITNSVTGTIYLNTGESIIFDVKSQYNFSYTPSTSGITNVVVSFNPQILSTSTLNVSLEPELVFGGLITYSSMLPKIKCSDFLRDILIRFGLILSVNEFDKVITISKFDKVIDNIPNHVNWTDKLDETEEPEIEFKYDSYSQNNNFLHKEDKTITSTPNGSNYNLVINNANLELERNIYTSPFGVSQNITFNGYLTTAINLYDTASSKFNRDTAYRICFAYSRSLAFKFTDSTSTSAYLNNILVYFIDQDRPQLSMGFELGLIPNNSRSIINILQNLRIVRCKVKLNIIDIMNLDFFKPVYLEQYQAYFFLSSINQFNYTNPQSTEVELIKLNQ